MPHTTDPAPHVGVDHLRPPQGDPERYDPDAAVAAAMRMELDCVDATYELAQNLADAVKPVWHWGDGYGGWVMKTIMEIFELNGLLTYDPDPKPKRKTTRRPLAKNLRRMVYERDAYRCVTCNTHLDLSVDHKIAVANGGSDDLDNLQTMCLPCNIRKGARP